MTHEKAEEMALKYSKSVKYYSGLVELTDAYLAGFRAAEAGMREEMGLLEKDLLEALRNEQESATAYGDLISDHATRKVYCRRLEAENAHMFNALQYVAEDGHTDCNICRTNEEHVKTVMAQVRESEKLAERWARLVAALEAIDAHIRELGATDVLSMEQMIAALKVISDALDATKSAHSCDKLSGNPGRLDAKKGTP